MTSYSSLLQGIKTIETSHLIFYTKSHQAGLRFNCLHLEHKDACCKGFTRKFAVTEHAWAEQHSNKWREIMVLDHVRRHKELLLKEALYIKTAPHMLHHNRLAGKALAAFSLVLLHSH